MRAVGAEAGNNVRQQEGGSKETLLNRQQGREESGSEKECRREVVLGGYYKNPE